MDCEHEYIDSDYGYDEKNPSIPIQIPILCCEITKNICTGRDSKECPLNQKEQA